MVTFLRDITERKQAEARIQTLNADLERRVEERTAQLYASETRLSHILTNHIRCRSWYHSGRAA
ncbi:MAG: hypothetical protein WCK70_20065 [Chloroflexales bacterium]|jgi:C4-dicarboxylate-specific signal transduction histidine kinase